MILVLVSILVGMLAMWTFRRIAKPDEIRRSVNRIQAHLLEFWLFQDEPSMIWKSWKGLIAANARFLSLLVLPLLMLAVPMTPLYFFLDAMYGSSPLPIDGPALVTVSFDNLDAAAVMEAPEGILIDSPPVRVYSERQVSWRIRPVRSLSGELQWLTANGRVTKTIVAGYGSNLISRRRTRSLLELVRYPAEAPLASGPIEWIEVSYPAAAVTLMGFDAHWSAWFFLFSLIGAWVPARIAKFTAFRRVLPGSSG
jgi:hypothetical protein